jgi:hypothetical protein
MDGPRSSECCVRKELLKGSPRDGAGSRLSARDLWVIAFLSVAIDSVQRADDAVHSCALALMSSGKK